MNAGPSTNSRVRAGAGRRVLMGVPAPGARSGGPALHLPMLVEDLRRHEGIDVRTFSYGRWRDREGFAAKLLHQCVDLVRYPFVVARAAPDLVHLNSAFDRRAIVRDVPFALLTRLLRRRLLVKWHGSETDLLAGGWLWRGLSRLLLASTHTFCVLSSEERRALETAGFAGPVAVVKNGLDLERYVEPGDAKARLGLAADVPLLLFIARLIPTKGLEDTMRAFARLPVGEAHLVVVGDGPSRRSAEREAAALGVRARVHFTGAIPEDEANDYYRSCDVLVFPTFHAEGFPMAIFQALASGMAIVTTRIRAAADHLREPDHCLFVPPRDPKALAAALTRLLQAPALRERMRRNNRDLAHAFDRRSVAHEFATIYAQTTRVANGSVAQERTR